MGQLEYFFNPSRISLSSNILKCSYYKPSYDFKIFTILPLKPHYGLSGDPFIKSRTSFDFKRASILSFMLNLCGVSAPLNSGPTTNWPKPFILQAGLPFKKTYGISGKALLTLQSIAVNSEVDY